MFLTQIVQQITTTASTTGQNVTLPTLPAITLSNAFGDMTTTLILVVLVIAMTIRQSSEYIEKYMKGEATSFNRKYLATAAIAFITSLPIAMGLLGPASEIFLAYFGTWGVAGALFMVGVYGYGWQHGINKSASLLGHFFTKKEEQPPAAQTKTS